MKIINPERAAHAFLLQGTPASWKEFGHGHINTTFKITTDIGAEYVLQRINTYVFKNPIQLMANAAAVTAFLALRLEDPRGALHFIPTAEGLFYYEDPDGEFWRMYDFVGGFCLDEPETQADLYQSALAFGRFQSLLSDFPAHSLFETIPDFHNTPQRFRQLAQTIASAAPEKLRKADADIDFLLQREEKGSILQKMLQRGELPLRVTHNDTKLNNVLFDSKTRKALCVLDLDTVMPGLSVHDFGDSIRFGAATAPEDEQNPKKMGLDLQLFRVYTRGFLETAVCLTDNEIHALPLGAYTITLELATRFLKDHLDGDLYFKTAYPGHNLVRARSQMALLADMEVKWEQMQNIVETCTTQVRK